MWFEWFDLGLRALNFNTVSHPIWSITKVGIELLGQLKSYKTRQIGAYLEGSSADEMWVNKLILDKTQFNYRTFGIFTHFQRRRHLYRYKSRLFDFSLPYWSKRVFSMPVGLVQV